MPPLDDIRMSSLNGFEEFADLTQSLAAMLIGSVTRNPTALYMPERLGNLNTELYNLYTTGISQV